MKAELNNKVILLRKSLKVALSQTKLNLAKNLKKSKKEDKNGRKRDELECLKRIKSSDIALATGLYPEKLQKLITNPNSENELRAGARVLMTNLIQKKLNEIKQKYGVETVQKFLEENTKNIKDRLENPNQKKTKTKTKGTKKEKKESESDESDFIEEPESESDDEAADEEVDDKVKIKKPKEVKSKKTKIHEKNPGKKEKNPAKKHKKNEASAQKSVDSFFMVADGENYLASVGATLSSDDEKEEKNEKQKSKKHPVKLGSAKKFKDMPEKPKSKTFTAKAITKPISTVEPELHPSWRAKAQLRIDSQIKDFQGTKIKFE